MSMIDVHFAGIWVSQTLQIYSSGLNSPKNENKKKNKNKNERKTECKPRKRIFSR